MRLASQMKCLPEENEKILNVKGRFVGYADFTLLSFLGKETVNVLDV